MKSKFDGERIASLAIERDNEPSDPRDNDNLGVMVCWHRRRTLGDIQLNKALKDWLKENAPKGSIILPLYLYEHSGITMSTDNTRYPFNDRFDAGQVGVIVATPAEIRKSFSTNRLTKAVLSKARSALEAEVRLYDFYLTDEVWAYVLTDCEGEEEYCGGFFGRTLDETGIKFHLPDNAIPLLQKAWDSRGE